MKRLGGMGACSCMPSGGGEHIAGPLGQGPPKQRLEAVVVLARSEHIVVIGQVALQHVG